MDNKLLLTSVFKPFGVDDEFGRKENVCELMQNQVTRGQGIFSLRSNQRSFALKFLAENLKIPATVLDFPRLEDFLKELKNGKYSHVGISFIVPNFEKAKYMAMLVRKESPGTKIILGGHGVAISNIEELIPCDAVCRGEGIRWLRRYFGEPEFSPIVHPVMTVDCYRRILGVPSPNPKALLVIGVGCSNRCDFCCTSHFFEGYSSYFQSADEIFQTMCNISDKLKTDEFFVFDENFLSDEKKTSRLLELMRSHNRHFKLDIFSSPDAVARYPLEVLIGLGIYFIWIGVESKIPIYSKTKGIDLKKLIGNLQSHGISVLASAILFLEKHDRKSLQEDIDHVIGLKPDLIQFMELCPLPGTTLFKKLHNEEKILYEITLMDWHGQDKIWFKHNVFSRNETKQILDSAFEKEYLTLGPSFLRIAESRISGVETGPLNVNDQFLYNRHLDLIRLTKEMRPLLRAFIKFSPNDEIKKKARSVEERFRKNFGSPTLLESWLSIIVLFAAHLERRKWRLGKVMHQPPTFIERYRQGSSSHS
ncbi:MAG: cobalamin-dependent protein [Candidatus Riflebacteria bacterium]|nr:cobalamin-dependent protein [Candidatus Riflebacteria bacterium]